MITLTISVPNVAQVLGAGFTELQLQKSANQQQSGSYSDVAGAIVALASNVTSYSLTDVLGNPGDWYVVIYTQAGGVNPSGPGAAMPGYLSDLCNTVRDLLGVTTNEVSDAQIQGFAYLPSALARVRTRLTSNSLTFDTLVASSGDAGAHALAALASLTAALLCPRMTVMVVDSEVFKDYRYQRNRQMDWTATQSELLAQYEMFISQAAGESAASALALMTGVALAGPTRAGYDTSGGLINVNQGVMNEAGTPPLPNDLPLPGEGIFE
jgi:hypothetical protein